MTLVQDDLFGTKVPIRKARLGYLTDLAELTHSSVWALAPIDTSLRPDGYTAPDVEHVWLHSDGALIEAVIDLATGDVIATRKGPPQHDRST